MVVTEIALLHLKKNEPLSAPSNKELKAKLHHAIRAQAAHAKSAVFLLSQLEDPSYIYILGKWPSVAAHMEEWVPSETNQGLLEALKDDVEVVWVQHIDMDPSPRKRDSPEDEWIPYYCSATAIGRCFVAPEDRDGFDARFREKKVYLKSYLKGIDEARTMIGGWRLDPEMDEEGKTKEEFVLVSGWSSREEHAAFHESEGFEEFRKATEFMKGMDVKHAKWIDAS